MLPHTVWRKPGKGRKKEGGKGTIVLGLAPPWKLVWKKWKTPYSDISYWKFLFSAKKTKFLSGVWIILDCFVLSNSSRVTIFFTLFFNLSSRSWGVSSQPAEIQSSQFFGGILFFTVSLILWNGMILLTT